MGKIVEVSRHPDADALYVEKIDIGMYHFAVYVIFFLMLSICLLKPSERDTHTHLRSPIACPASLLCQAPCVSK